MSDEKSNLKAFPKRKPITNSVRFDVFKRDAFTCQYCGGKAPDVVLNVDHIRPVADGGENEIINLITSCFTCNSGKGATALDDNSALEKQRRQLEDLNERRNQLELLVKWRESLSNMEDAYVQAIQDEFLRFSSFTANESGVGDMRRWLKKYSIDEVLSAVRKSFGTYLKFEDGKEDSESWNKAFSMVPRIIEVDRRGGMPPDKMRVFYARGILRRRLSYVNERDVVWMIEGAAAAGADIEDIIQFTKTARNWKAFEEEMFALILPGDGK